MSSPTPSCEFVKKIQNFYSYFFYLELHECDLQQPIILMAGQALKDQLIAQCRTGFHPSVKKGFKSACFHVMNDIRNQFCEPEPPFLAEARQKKTAPPTVQVPAPAPTVFILTKFAEKYLR